MSQQPAPPDSPAPRRPATLADWEAVPAPYTGHLIDGRLYVLPRPTSLHAEALAGVLDELRGPFHRGRGGPGGWLILPEVDVRLGADIVAPDIAGWRRERLAQPPPQRPILVAPDWVCEVLSPRTETFDRSAKADWYQQAGVGWMWFIDPEAQLLEAYENDGGQFRQRHRFQGNVAVTVPPFEILSWSLGLLWG